MSAGTLMVNGRLPGPVSVNGSGTLPGPGAVGPEIATGGTVTAGALLMPETWGMKPIIVRKIKLRWNVKADTGHSVGYERRIRLLLCCFT